MEETIAYVTGYAVIRVDELPVDPPSSHEMLLDGLPFITAGPSHVTVKEIVMTAEEARREVARLNKLNNEKGCAYHWQSTHIFLKGGSHGSATDRGADGSHLT